MYAEQRLIPIGLVGKRKHRDANGANCGEFSEDADVHPSAVFQVIRNPDEMAMFMFRAFLKNYLPRHRNRVNQFLHLIGVPLTFVGTPWTFFAGAAAWWPCACFVGGYLLQFAGHAVEGNDAGEAVFVKRMLGMPYTEYSPGAASSSDADGNDDISAG
ncbi:MAG TPA: DUF962 domain-containing protein [Planctomycetaceae bacterium]|nr:DUF962 domain-containing protein [Planctomycetaceae bacterium]